MNFETLISCADAHAHLADPDWVFVDSRYSLTDSSQGERDYQAGHIPGAVYAHLGHDLSGRAIPGKTGRHPIPDEADCVAAFENLGITNASQVVSYDANNGVMASRLWWLLRWAGHTKVAVLDGGFGHWATTGLPMRPGTEVRARGSFTPHFVSGLNVDLAMVDKLRHDPAYALLDVRTADRYRGENETIDAVGGHIPGSRNLPFNQHLGADGLHVAPDTLLAQFAQAEDGRDADHVVFSCGSGVTAAHAAMLHLHAGLAMPKIYAGSFSEWIANPSRRVATGPNP